MPLKPYIRAALSHEDLESGVARDAMGIVMRGEASVAQIAAWLVALRQKGESTGEITGFAQSLRDEMILLPDTPANAIDTCGTGGDGLGTFNISTTTALIVAACGVPVAKHGNRSVSSQSGSADVLTALGIDIESSVERCSHMLHDHKFAFLFAPRFHPAMRHAAPARHEIGVRTVFNLLGPLCNPAQVKRQVVGVYDRSRLEQIASVLGALGAERALVVSGPHGADELLPCGENVIVEWDGSQLRTYRLRAADAGLSEVPLETLQGGDAEFNAQITRAIAAGQEGPMSETALLNAGAALYVAGRAETIGDGVVLSRNAVREGKLADLLSRLCKDRAV